jgi:hypothetical protein
MLKVATTGRCNFSDDDVKACKAGICRCFFGALLTSVTADGQVQFLDDLLLPTLQLHVLQILQKV